jgi:large subunit ribosomal protein L21
VCSHFHCCCCLACCCCCCCYRLLLLLLLSSAAAAAATSTPCASTAADLQDAVGDWQVLPEGGSSACNESFVVVRCRQPQGGLRGSLAGGPRASARPGAARVKDETVFDPFDQDDDDDDEATVNANADNENETDSDDDGDFDKDDGDFGTIYNNDGSLKRTKTEKSILRAGAPAGGLFAVVQMPESQFKVTTDDLLIVNRVPTYQVGAIYTLDKVLLVGSNNWTLVGLPIVAGAEVDVMVEEITHDAKVVVFKKRRRKHSQRKNGARRDVTMLRILDIRVPDSVDLEYKERDLPASQQQERVVEIDKVA